MAEREAILTGAGEARIMAFGLFDFIDDISELETCPKCHAMVLKTAMKSVRRHLIFREKMCDVCWNTYQREKAKKDGKSV